MIDIKISSCDFGFVCVHFIISHFFLSIKSGKTADLDETFNSTLNDIIKVGYEEYTRNEVDEECDEAEI